MVLLIDTTTATLCLGIYNQGTYIGSHKCNRNHAEIILIELDLLLKTSGFTLSDVKYIATGVGPGSFAGCKIGSAIVQSIIAAMDIPLITFSSMLAMALTHKAELDSGIVTVLTYANVDNFYVGQYSDKVILERLVKRNEIDKYITGDVYSDHRAHMVYPQCKLMSHPLNLEKLVPYVKMRMNNNMIDDVTINHYYL
jgi:tRNA threonylcarbamoyl adenosine modification protein YeaZ